MQKHGVKTLNRDRDSLLLLLLLLLFLASYIIDQWTLQCEWAKPEVTTKADV